MDKNKANPFPFTNDNKRYHTLSYHNSTVYGGKVYKFNFIEGLCIPNSLKRSFQFHIE